MTLDLFLGVKGLFVKVLIHVNGEVSFAFIDVGTLIFSPASSLNYACSLICHRVYLCMCDFWDFRSLSYHSDKKYLSCRRPPAASLFFC